MPPSWVYNRVRRLAMLGAWFVFLPFHPWSRGDEAALLCKCLFTQAIHTSSVRLLLVLSHLDIDTDLETTAGIHPMAGEGGGL